jgi:hypothetical protein
MMNSALASSDARFGNICETIKFICGRTHQIIDQRINA